MARVVLIGFALLLAFAAVPAVASAQAPAPVRNLKPRAVFTNNSANAVAKKTAKKTVKKTVKKANGEKTSKAMALVFWLFALMCIGGSVFVVTRRNLIAAVMGMVGTFFAIAAVYAMLYAHFLAAIQVLVYAGAIMVLFVFVIMILNRPEDEPWAKQGTWGTGVAVAATLYLVYRMVDVLWAVEAPLTGKGPGKVIDKTDFGSTAEVGKVLFQDYIFPFEAVSIVLLVAVVGAIAVARPNENRETANIAGAAAGAAADADAKGGAA